MNKKLCASSVVRQMDEAVANYNANHKKGITSDSRVHVARVMLVSKQNSRMNNATKRDNAPFLCFMRGASCNKTVIVGIESGEAKIVSNSSLVIKVKNMDTFSLNGVRYKMKDCVNGLPRFTVAHANSRSAKVEQI